MDIYIIGIASVYASAVFLGISTGVVAILIRLMFVRGNKRAVDN